MALICCSLNQVEHTARKSVRGVGLPWGLAEDAGRAVRWLQAGGLDGVTALVGLLRQTDDSAVSGAPVAVVDGGWRTTTPAGCLLAAAAIADGVVAGRLDPARAQLGDTIRLQGVFSPMIILGFAGVAASQIGRGVRISWPGVDVWCEGENIISAGNLSTLNKMASADVVVSFGHLPDGVCPETVLVGKGSTRISERDWRQLESWARRTYVPASEQSRLSGAGAGVSDND